MKIKINRPGQYDITINENLFGQVADGRKFNLYARDGLNWKIYCVDTNNFLHNMRFKTLREAKRHLKKYSDTH